MVTFESTALWVRTLARQPEPDEFQGERERLRNAFMSFRERASLLAGEIARDLPDYTVHDITHLDALWQMGDLIAGSTYEINPIEAFVLGGAFLIHDLGNGLAAYPDGVAAMYASQAWSDAVSIALRKSSGKAPSPEQIQTADEQIKKEATSHVLRAFHAQHAERLALISWIDPENGLQRFLIEDVFLRETYGRLIGRIAHSHWWSVEKLKPEFDTLMGAPITCPSAWTVDPLKIACLLRLADAAHLDARRAPAFLRTIRVPTEDSRKHWLFQEKLQQPIRNGDRLLYTSSRPFTPAETSAWWVCFEALQILNRELEESDSMLSDCNRERCVVRGVQGAEDARRLSKWIQTEHWAPVDTRIKVTDVAELATRLGGAQLYGDDHLVPLRELIQNAGDAIRARRHLEKSPADYGDIVVGLGADSEGNWLEVTDNGIGMSERVMTGPLLDFGTSFWNSEMMVQELPGLASSGFDSTGKYGIGFFSLFMWGKHVRVKSRSYHDAPRDTRVLEFVKGLNVRPILRRATGDEQLTEGGTAIRIWVGSAPEREGGVLFRKHRVRKKLEEMCEWVCPAIDANLYVQRENKAKSLIVRASDWKTIDGKRLLKRVIEDSDEGLFGGQLRALIPVLAPNLRTIKDSDGAVIARVTVIPDETFSVYNFGAVTAGGLRVCGVRGVAGILVGVTTVASRTSAIPIVEASSLAGWASAQAALIASMRLESPNLSRAANTIGQCGGSVAKLPVAESSKGWL